MFSTKSLFLLICLNAYSHAFIATPSRLSSRGLSSQSYPISSMSCENTAKERQFVSTSATRSIGQQSTMAISSNCGKHILVHVQSRQRSMLLSAKRNNDVNDEDNQINDDKENKNNKVDRDMIGFRSGLQYIEEPRLIAIDLLAILITCELLGLTDVLLSSGFWKSGGIFQPITMSSFSSMGLLIKRDSLLSICWVLSGIRNRGYSYSAIATNLGLVKSSFTIFTDFCIFLILSMLGLAVAEGGAPVDVLELVREVWYSITVVGAFRLAYSSSQLGRF